MMFSFSSCPFRSLLRVALTWLLLIPIAGLRFTDGVTGVSVVFDPWLPLLLTAAAFFFFFAARQIENLKTPLQNVKACLPALPRLSYLLPLFIAAILVLPMTPLANRYLLDVMMTVMTYILLAWGMSIVIGMAGLLDLGYVAFYAVGAYGYALLAPYLGLGFWSFLPIAALLAGSVALIIGMPVLRLKGDYLAIVTLGLGEVTRLLLINLTNITGGPNGVGGIDRPTLFGVEFTRDGLAALGITYDPLYRVIFLYYVIFLLVVLVGLLIRRLKKMPLGRALEALREDEIAATAMGLNTHRLKLTAYVMAAMIGGITGSFFAAKQGFISPESFGFLETAIVLAMVVLGGMGSLRGIALAAILLVALPEVARAIGDYRMLIFGGVMVLMMNWRPEGLVAGRLVSYVLPQDKKGGAV